MADQHLKEGYLSGKDRFHHKDPTSEAIIYSWPQLKPKLLTFYQNFQKLSKDFHACLVTLIWFWNVIPPSAKRDGLTNFIMTKQWYLFWFYVWLEANYLLLKCLSVHLCSFKNKYLWSCFSFKRVNANGRSTPDRYGRTTPEHFGRRTPDSLTPGRQTPDHSSSGRRTPEPQFKNPRVGALFNKWRNVWLMAMERQRRLQDALDNLNEVRHYSFVFFLQRRKLWS